MDFTLTNDQTAIKSMVQSFAKEKMEPIVFIKINKQEPLVAFNAEYFLNLVEHYGK